MLAKITDELGLYIQEGLNIEYDKKFSFLSIKDGIYTLFDYYGYDTPPTRKFKESDYQDWLRNKKINNVRT